LKNYSVRLYQKNDYENWNAFIGQAKNATFLFHRDFMEYHSDRFKDYSLIVLDGEKWVAVLPANVLGNKVFSHLGLSYGSLIVKSELRVKRYVSIFKLLMQFLYFNDILIFELKVLPKIYNKTLSDEVDYVAFLMKADNYRSDIYLTIDMYNKYQPNRNRIRALKLANKLDFQIKEEKDYASFWNKILVPNLKERFDVSPVHTIDEIKKLAELFPDAIKLFNAYQDTVLKAGVVMFVTETVAHFQYSSGGEDRNESAALDVLFDFIIKKYSNKKYVSFGSSSEENGRKLNEGLAYWKESFGAKTGIQSFFRFTTANHFLLDSVLI